ncbi:FecR family protein [Corallococcus sp. M34]|uniref:FecR domain-containing protein n=1 Tax=Citreicoccus inhibens TaxID=2849499 RepID=UPI0018F6EBBB|nr:FecR domain-containing protein [Citreicoccus inhibens]MBU8897702.1 FecR family protein [Citreicoccus inhibens]
MLFALALPALTPGCSAEEKPSASVSAPVPAAVARAHLRELKGDVQIKRASADEWSAAREGQALYENDKVRTEAGAGAQVVFASGSTVHLGGDSLIGIAETKLRTDVTVLRGRIDASLEQPATQSLSVTTPAATVRAGRKIEFQ